MPTLVLDAFVGHDACVVGVRQHDVPFVGGHHDGIPVSPSMAWLQPQVSHLLGQPNHRIFAAGIELEALADEIGSLRVDGDGADQSAVNIFLDVEVAQG